jgi:hypothetical protein
VPPLAVCRREIETLHAVFTRWYRGQSTRAEFDRVERALDASFERVAPDGTVDSRETVLAGIREQYDSYDQFGIDIRDVRRVVATGDHTLVRYEEWQTTPGGTNGRLSTALFAPVDSPDPADDTRPSAAWRHLQETWLDAPE